MLPLRVALLAIFAVALLAPTATAHTSVFSSDNLVRGSVGLLNEPAVTYQQSGLDVCFTENTTARAPLAVNPGNLTAILTAPSGQVLTMALKAQFGRTGCITFDQALVPTEPGQYTVNLTGTVNGSAIAVTGVKAGGAVTDQSDITFPSTGVPSLLDLQTRVDALQLQITDLQAQLAALESDAAKDEGKFSPGAPAALLMVGLAALVIVRRRSA